MVKNNFELSIIDFLRKGINPKDIANQLNISLPRLSYWLSKLKNKGIIKRNGTIWEVDLINQLKTSSKADISQPDHSRGHAFIWKVKIKERYDWKKLLNEKQINYDEIGTYGTPRIILNNNKIWLGKEHIIIYENNSYFAKNSLESKKLAIYSLLHELKALSEYLSIPPFSNIKFTCSREHYSLIKNILAIQCNKNNEKINIFNEKGLWLSIDDSFNLGELETLGSIANKPMETNLQVQRWWNENKETKFEVTPKFILNSLNGMVQNANLYNENISSHIEAIKQLGKGVNKLTKVMKGVLTENQNLKLSSKHQTKLGDFI